VFLPGNQEVTDCIGDNVGILYKMAKICIFLALGNRVEAIES
jgi:hypothetical protein